MNTTRIAKKSQRWTEGALLDIDAHGHQCKAQMLKSPEVAFFDPLEPENILFRLWVHKSAFNNGRWLKTGKQPISGDLENEIPRFKKNAISGKLSIYINGSEKSASYEECKDLECSAMWEPEHVEGRLRDYCENKENKWVKSLTLSNGA